MMTIHGLTEKLSEPLFLLLLFQISTSVCLLKQLQGFVIAAALYDNIYHFIFITFYSSVSANLFLRPGLWP